MHVLLKLRAFSITFRKDDRGATAIEYGLIAAGIAVAIIAVVFAVGFELDDLFKFIAKAFKEARCVEVGSSCGK